MTLDPDAPTVVGALGGSGTRVVGQLLLDLGVHLGTHRNPAEDSLTASLLFNRPGDEGDFDQRVARFEQVGRLIRGEASWRDRAAMLRAVAGVEHPPLRFRLEYAIGAVRERGPAADAAGWGFKEPNTHLFLDELDSAFPAMRYIYVMRHPLDMAFSGNLQQLHNWAPTFDIDVPADPAAIPAAQLDLWLAATQRATTSGTELLGDRFWALDYERLVDDPTGGVDQLIRFIGSAASTTRNRLVTMIERPATMGRYQGQDLSQFRPEQLDAVHQYGFTA